ncbi:diiron oxygenase [Actinomadura fibrosa]|uniref:Diiron oxygenase n=1 Tax=Actinomadura fibrosa TaxID=111802 RepID=A0ABW2XY14_9ACTN|nr:diiron oxygenase [Actinomadura fibrosa]
MTTTEVAERLRGDRRFQDVLGRLVEMSERDYYNPYRLFDWPDSLPDDAYWMTPELMAEHGTDVWDELPEPRRRALSKWQSINFYSLNVHGIRELLHEIVARIHTADFDVPSEYFHHIIGEENEHMWFFAAFCRRYGGKIYPPRSLRLAGPGIAGADHFLVFARLLVFEELVDVFNQRMAGDDRLHPTIRKVNEVHHQDESRHIAFGRQIVAMLHADLRERLGDGELAALEDYLKGYMRGSVASLCEPGAYRDAGIPEPYAVRRRVLASPAHAGYARRVLRRTESFMVNAGIFRTGLPESAKE